ncbi:MAG: MarR family winged helix-turn-helix transcriptional regulator [Pseudomonadota bacterium]
MDDTAGTPDTTTNPGASTPRQSESRTALPLTTSRRELLVNDSDRNFRELVHELFAFLARHEEIRAGHGRSIGLRGIEYTVLISIGHLGNYGDVNIKTIADHLHLSGTFITKVTNQLAAEGLVDKTSDAADQRRIMLDITPKGYGLLEKLAPVQRQVNDVEFGCLDGEEFESLLGIVRKLVDSSSQAVALQKYLNQKPD